MANIGLRKYYTSAATWWSDMQDFMIACGWTLHDNIDANTKVYKTNGKDADKPYIYLRLSNSSGTVQGTLYLYWNAGTHTGTTTTAYYNNTAAYPNPGYGLMIGNADFVYIAGTATGNIIFAGYTTKRLDTTGTTTTGAITAGSNVSVPVVSTTGFKKGQKVQMVGVNYEGRDQLTVDEVTDSTHLKINSLPRNYASGAFVGTVPCPAFLAGANYDINNIGLLCPRNAAGTANSTGSQIGSISFDYLGRTHHDPDQASGYYNLYPWILTFTNENIVGYIDEMLLVTGLSATRDDVFGINAAGTPDQGTASSATSTTLSDATKSWTIDALIGKFVVIVDGTGNGQCRKITDNDGTSVTVDTWDTTPSTDSTYRIVDAVYRYFTNYLVVLEDRCLLS